MRKIFTVATIFCLFGYNIFAVDTSEKKIVNVDDEIASLKQGIAEAHSKNSKLEADNYLVKAKDASAKGQTELAKAYKSCSAAGNKIAEGYKTGNQKMIDAGNSALFEATASVKKCKRHLKTKVDELVTKYNAIISGYKKSADDYLKKASQAKKDGKHELYTIYNYCADAKNKIVTGLNSILNGKEQYRKAVDVYNEFASAENLLNADDGLVMKKGMNMNATADNLGQSSEAYIAEARQAESVGNAQLALVYTQISSSKKAEADGLKTVAEGKSDYKRSSARLKEYQETETKEEPVNTETNK